jgi:hypothetical protein
MQKKERKTNEQASSSSTALVMTVKRAIAKTPSRTRTEKRIEARVMRPEHTTLREEGGEEDAKELTTPGVGLALHGGTPGAVALGALVISLLALAMAGVKEGGQ